MGIWGRPRWKRRTGGAASAALLLALAPAPLLAQATATAADVKAAFILKFGAFVDWPAASAGPANAPMTVCIVGRDRVATVIGRQAAGATVGARPVTVRRLTTISAQSGCHIAYIGGSADQSVADGLRAVAAAPVLTITDADHGEAQGMIHFAMQQKRVKFHIDTGAATRSGLTFSSKLLALALSVKP